MNPRNIKFIARIVAVMMLLALLAGLTPGAVVPAYAAPGDITRISVDSSGAQANGGSTRGQLSADGRYVSFVSGATNLISDDTNNAEDVFVKDRQTGATTRVSVASVTGAQANNGSTVSAISSDGRYVAFYSDASNLVSGDTNGIGDIFVRDRQAGVTTRVSVDSSGHEANGENSDYYLAISGDGRYVAFLSEATNLVSGDTNNVKDTFVHDRQTGQTRRVSVASNGTEANAGSLAMDISDDGRYVTFSSGATNLVAGDTNGTRDVFVYDLQTGGITLVSVSTSGEQADGGGNSPSISGDGRYIVFLSNSHNLSTEGDYYFGKELVYVRDRQIGQTTLASVHSEGWTMIAGILDQPTISTNGRYVAFSFYDKGDNNGIMHVWVRDLQMGTSIKVEGGDGSGHPSLSADGKFVAFNSGSSNLVSGDTNGASDVFIREVAYGPERNPTVVSITPTCGRYHNYCPYPTSSSVSFVVIFSEQVTDVGVDDFSLDMLDGITGASITGVSGYGIEYYVTVDTGTGDGKLLLKLIDNDSIKDTSLNPLGGAGIGNGDFITGYQYWIDKSMPTVTSIVRADPNPAAAGTVRFTVSFSEVVWPVRPDDFVLSTTGSISGASVTAISPREDEYIGSATYTVTVDTGSGGGSLRLDLIDDDTIGDWDSPSPLGGVGVGNGSFITGETYTIGNSIPSIPSVTGSLRADANPTSAASVNFTVTFSEAVSGVDPSDFSLTTTGSLSGVLVTNVSGSGNTYTVTVGTGSGAGNLRLDIVDNDSILNASNSPLGGSGAGNGNFTSGEAYTINRVVPFPTVISSLSSEPNATNAASVHFTVTFSEAVTGVDPIDFTTFVTGDISSATVASVSGSGTIYTVTINLGSGNGTVRLDVLDNDSIVNASNSPLGGPGAGNGNFMGGNQTINQTVVISILLADPNYTSADIVHFNVTFSESVSGVDASDFVIATTGVISSVAVTGVSGSGNIYVVTMSTGTGDGTLRIDLIDDDSIINTAGNPLGGVGPGTGNFRPGETYSIDKNAPIMFSSLRMDANPSTATSVRFIVTFSEAVTGVDVNDFALTTANLTGASIAGVEIGVSGFTFIVTVSTGSGNGTLRLDLIDNDSIVDDVNHQLGGVGVGNGSFITGEVYTINKFSPAILNTSYRSTGSSDGWVLESSENSNLGGSKNSAAAVFKLGDDAQDRQFRSVLHFPTYYLPDNAVVMQAILMIKKQDVIGTDPFTTHQNISIDIRKGYFSNFNLFSFGSLQDTDYQATADMYMVGTIQNNPVSGWYWAALDSRAFPYINLKDVTQLRLAFQLDDNDDMGDDYIRFYSGDYDAQKDRPHLLIEYYVPR